MDALIKLQKELARVLNVIPPLPPIPAETTYNIKCTPPIKGWGSEDRRHQRTQSGQTIRFSIALDRSIPFGRSLNFAHIHYYNTWHTLNLKPVPQQHQYQDRGNYLQHWTKGKEGNAVLATPVSRKNEYRSKLTPTKLHNTDQEPHSKQRTGQESEEDSTTHQIGPDLPIPCSNNGTNRGHQLKSEKWRLFLLASSLSV
jgi:hypothetical protein